jgi:phosphoglycerate dehydrogenase-like enzyme
VARRLRGFGCTLLYSGPRRKPDAEAETGARYVDFGTLLAESDFVTVHSPLNEATRGLFGMDAFLKMKPGAVFVNTSRGGLVDQAALVAALTTGAIAAAGLDVTTPEPLTTDHPLFSLPNCVVLPHIGSASIATRTKMATMAAENLIAGVRGKALPNSVK